jgi:ketosteroid isomerase-like protein
MTIENMTVRVDGDIAVLTAERTAKSTLRGKDTSGRQRIMRVLVKRQGRWQPVAMQATRIQ